MKTKRSTNTRDVIEKLGVDAVVSALQACGSFMEAAKLIGVSTWGLRQFAKRHGIEIITQYTVHRDIVIEAERR